MEFDWSEFINDIDFQSNFQAPIPELPENENVDFFRLHTDVTSSATESVSGGLGVEQPQQQAHILPTTQYCAFPVQSLGAGANTQIDMGQSLGGVPRLDTAAMGAVQPQAPLPTSQLELHLLASGSSDTISVLHDLELFVPQISAPPPPPPSTPSSTVCFVQDDPEVRLSETLAHAIEEAQQQQRDEQTHFREVVEQHERTKKYFSNQLYRLRLRRRRLMESLQLKWMETNVLMPDPDNNILGTPGVYSTPVNLDLSPSQQQLSEQRSNPADGRGSNVQYGSMHMFGQRSYQNVRFRTNLGCVCV